MTEQSNLPSIHDVPCPQMETKRMMKDGIINLATTIPADQIRNAGEPVFPALRAWLREIGADALIPLIDAREAYGIAKYGQTLMTGDDRDTATEAANETADQLAYGQKAKMQYPALRGLINDAMLFSVQAALAWMDAIELMQQEPWTQAELDRAEVKAQELKSLLMEEPN